MASKYDSRKIIWKITNCTRPALNNFDQKGSVFTDWFEIYVNGKTERCRFEFQPNNYARCYIRLKCETSRNITSSNDVSFELNDLTVKHYESFYSTWSIGHIELFHESKKFINNDTLTIIMDILFFKAAFITVEYHRDEFNKADAEYFNSSTFSDFTIICRDGDQIPAHRTILARSSVFKAMLNSDMIESTTAQVRIEDIDGAAMLEVLRYLYTGKAQNLFEHGSQIIYAANKYDLGRLKKMCVDYLTEKISIANVLETFIIADEHNEEHLAQLCLSFIKNCYDELRASDSWKKLSMDLMLKIMDSYQKTTTLTFNTRLDG